MSTNPDITATEGRIPPRSAISALTLADETGVVRSLIERAQLSPQQEAEVASLARRLVHAVRAGRRQTGGVDAFMNEYSLSSEEGVVLMCLAEALLRIPDGETADKLIADKIGGRNWDEHVGKSDSLFVNASSWGLMLTGRFVGLGDDAVADFQGYLKRLVARSGEPIIRQAMRHAMRIMGKQFVLGRTVEEAMKVGGDDARRGYRFSFDMLGEAAMTAHDAERYLAAYENALKVVAAHAGPWTDDAEVFARPSISVKLSAIHPRYEEGQKDRVMAELVPRLVRLAELARDANLGLTVDAEEAERLDISLEVFAAAANAKALAGWNGLGLAVQAYGKRAHAVLEWLAELAGTSGRRLPVRLVKGAYWDTEIKRAQEQGLDSYPVFTRKASTDVSYLACARLMLDRPETFFPQFATHNAHTLSAITVMAGNSRDFEFQRLHGMGQALYEEVVGKDKLGVACRIYAPVGSHEDLLAYLVRRLLENGANTSFVNRLADDEAPIREIIADPVEIVRSFASIGHPRIPLPRDLFAPERANSTGIVLWEPAARAAVYRGMEASLDAPVTASAIVDGAARGSAAREVTAPHDRRVTVGRVLEAGDGDADAALASAAGAFEDWDRMGGEARARLLDRAADLFERDRMRLMAVIVREAGKTLKNALGDIREAVDFLRYYAARARAEFERPTPLPGPTGERNELSLHGRGVFVSISPWNFPLAIFTGQVAAGLAAGNTVIAKPAE
jgi:RHH-type transcriptional regulator, proline utilization regulon repressor / proline dehydrogenase / delta 1-pyrroline-5-carboxylate dehydrogenase